jgi:UDP-N-acetylmuramoyl-L-alanyl-D-glutamate--2,6-diaminopimelate ligase
MTEGRPLGELIRLLEARGLLRSLLPGPAASGDARVRGVTLDSRMVEPGWLFVAIAGARQDGHEFAPQAVARGAVALIGERAIARAGVPQLLVTNVRAALALASAWFFDFPSHGLGVIGITGTDGKTTTSYLVRAMLQAAGQPTGLVSTIETIAGGQVIGRGRQTTPEAPELQADLAAMVAASDRWAVVESTSHGLAQERVGEVAYDVAVLTNVTHEHLEFHRTLEAYRAAKRSLFERLAVGHANPEKGFGKWAVVNLDDPIGADFGAAAERAGARVIGYGADPSAQVKVTGVDEDARGIRLTVATQRGELELGLPLTGRFNVHNALAAVGVGEALGLDQAAMRRGLESVRGVPGRMERIDAGQPFTVIVDYAHTPEALAKVLDNLAPVAAAAGGGLIAVFGSAGERDTAKRPMMGRVAGERCRLVVVTDEDPRGEDRQRILEEIAAGAEETGKRRDVDLLLIADRRQAIAEAFSQARPGDVVVLCGKGHERTIEMASGPIDWDEAAVARQELAALGYGEDGGASEGDADGEGDPDGSGMGVGVGDGVGDAVGVGESEGTGDRVGGTNGVGEGEGVGAG